MTEATRDPGSVVIVGAGLAGFNAAEKLRALGATGAITIVDSEPAAYDRPPLSKELFEDTFTLEKLGFATAEKFAAQNIETVFNVGVSAIDADAPSVTLSDGRVLNADTVLIATGGRARQLAIPGIDLPGVHTLRTWSDAVALRSAIGPSTRLAIVGAGLIGAEFASAARKQGADVTLVDPAPLPIVPAVGELMATYLHGMHDSYGVTKITGLPVAIEAANGALELVLEAGDRVPADVIVVGVGIVPNSELAENAGIAVDNGILVNHSQQTSAPAVFAAGDVARYREADGSMHRREEHWEAAQLSGQAAAYGMLGLPIPERGAPWFWSDRYDVHLEAVGRLIGPGELVVREGGAHPAVFLVEDGLVVGAASIDDNTVVRAARRLIDRKIPVSVDDLANPDVQLRALLKG